MKTRSVGKLSSKNYLQRAEECKTSMNNAFEIGNWNSCVINAIHCAIAAADALCIFKLGLRNASENHFDSVNLFLSTDNGGNITQSYANHLVGLLKIKTDAEYGERLLNRGNADDAIKHAERLFSFVKSKIKV